MIELAFLLSTLKTEFFTQNHASRHILMTLDDSNLENLGHSGTKSLDYPQKTHNLHVGKGSPQFNFGDYQMALFLRGKTWWVEKKVNGKRIRKTTKCTDREEAEAFVAEMFPSDSERSMKAIADTYSDILYEDARIPLTDCLGLFMASYTAKRPKPAERTIGDKEIIWNDFYQFLIQNHPKVQMLNQITPKIAEEFIAYLSVNGRFVKTVSVKSKKRKQITRKTADKLSSTRIKSFLSALKYIFSILTKESKMENPFSQITVTANKLPRDVFTMEELKLIHDQGTPFVKAIFVVGMYTGLREGDICSLLWSEVDLVKRVITREMRKGRHRNQAPIEIPILPGLQQFLESLPTDDKYVFPEHAKMYLNGNQTTISNRVKSCLRKLNIESRRKVEGRARAQSLKDVHSLRHTFCYLAAINGISIAVIQSIVGHMDMKMTQRYMNHASEDEKRKQMENLPDMFGELPPPEPLEVKSEVLSPDPVKERLEKLKDLFEGDLISEAEYTESKNRILAEI